MWVLLTVNNLNPPSKATGCICLTFLQSVFFRCLLKLPDLAMWNLHPPARVTSKNSNIHQKTFTAVLYFSVIWVVKCDRPKYPMSNNRGHLVGRLTRASSIFINSNIHQKTLSFVFGVCIYLKYFFVILYYILVFFASNICLLLFTLYCCCVIYTYCFNYLFVTLYCC